MRWSKGQAKYCYAQGQPQSSAPVIKRDPIFFLVTDWPSRGNPAEPSIVPSYNYKTGSSVTVDVGSDKFKFFTRATRAAATPGPRIRRDEPRVVDGDEDQPTTPSSPARRSSGVETRDV